MKLSEGIKKAYEIKWSMANTFTIQFHLPPKLEYVVGKIDEDINLHITSFNTPDIVNDPIEIFVNNQWRIQNGKDQVYRFNATFKDHDQMSLYKQFLAIYMATKTSYFDNVAMTVILLKDADWASDNGGGENKEKSIMAYGGTIIEGVSNLALSNDIENQIAEFTVSFKCNNPYIPSI